MDPKQEVDLPESGEDFFDAHEELPEGAEAASTPSSTVEEDHDFFEMEDMSGKLVRFVVVLALRPSPTARAQIGLGLGLGHRLV